eukprot:scaffold1307_cov200-Pinguiococcus_pyrenoidosus.AAC.69
MSGGARCVGTVVEDPPSTGDGNANKTIPHAFRPEQTRAAPRTQEFAVMYYLYNKWHNLGRQVHSLDVCQGVDLLWLLCHMQESTSHELRFLVHHLVDPRELQRAAARLAVGARSARAVTARRFAVTGTLLVLGVALAGHLKRADSWRRQRDPSEASQREAEQNSMLT